MNTSYNYADFIKMDLTSNDDFEPYGYEAQPQKTTYESESPADTQIKNRPLNHGKYQAYSE